MKKKSSKISDILCEESSGNVFADLGVKNPEEALLKAQIAAAISQLIRRLHLTQAQAAKKIGIDQPKISMLLNGRLRDFSIERLFRFLAALEQDIHITITPHKKSRRYAQRVSVQLAA